MTAAKKLSIHRLWIDGSPVQPGKSDLYVVVRQPDGGRPEHLEWEVRVDSDQFFDEPAGNHRVEAEVEGDRRLQGIASLDQVEGSHMLFTGVGELLGFDRDELEHD